MEVSQGSLNYIPCRAEISAPGCDWELTWRRCRLNGLGSELVSFNFKLLHSLLVTKKRMNQLHRNSSPLCILCDDQVDEDLQHALLSCKHNDGAGQWLMSVVEDQIPNITAEALLRLDLPVMSEENELAITLLISVVLSEIWDRRMKKVRIRLFEIRSTLEARCLLLRETRFKSHASVLTEFLNLM